MRFVQRSRNILTLFIICCCILLFTAGVYGDELNSSRTAQTISFKLVDAGEYNLERVSLMKAGEYYRDGQSHQYQQIEYSKETGEIIWNPCNDNSCSVISLPASGGKTGRDELVLEVFAVNPSVNVDSCYGDTTCERLKGSSRTISGMVEGMFHTGKTYNISISSLKPGIGESFLVTEDE